MNFQEQINKSISEIVESGFIENAIKERMEKTIEEIIFSVLKPWSSFGETLKNKMEESLQVNFDKITLSEYNVLIVQEVKKAIDESIFKKASESIAKQVESYVTPFKKKEIRLSEIVAKIIESIGEHSDEREGELTLIIEETDYGSTWVSIDPEEGKESYLCMFQFSISNELGSIGTFEVKDKFHKTITSDRFFHQSVYDKAIRFLFKVYASGIKVIIDPDKCDTIWSVEESYY